MKIKKNFLFPIAAVMMLTFTSFASASEPEQRETDPIRGPKCDQYGNCQGRP